MDYINKVGTLIIKIGSSLVYSMGCIEGNDILNNLIHQISQLKKKGIRVVLVSSGAISYGMEILGWDKRPLEINKLQAAASVGQVGLVRFYEKAFNDFSIKTSQILLTHDDIKNRTRYLNSRMTILTLLELGIVPIINENDSVSFREIKFGDNDTLAELVVNLIEADSLIILTDCDGLFDDDPNTNPSAKMIRSISIDDPIIDKVAKGTSSSIGTGGMITKVKAAKIASQSGAFTIVASGFHKNVILKILSGEEIGTYFGVNNNNRINAKKKWMLSNLIVSGNVYIDNGAKEALIKNKSSLLPIGCIKIDGNFIRGELVSIKDESGLEIARGLVNYSSDNASRIIKVKSSDIINILGFISEEELIHRDNMVYCFNND